MQQTAIYVRHPLITPGSIISKEDQETPCRDYCQAIGLTVSPRSETTPAPGTSTPG